MLEQSTRKALLIFAKQPIPGKVKTRLVPPLSPEQAAALYRCMVEDVLAGVAQFRDIDRFLFYEDGEGAREFFRKKVTGMTLAPQRGDDLGKRMAAAFGAVFALGYKAAVIIGSDAPDLPLSYIEEAFARLDNGGDGAVFGPCEDGGYYLLGLTRLADGLFLDVPWSSGAVLGESLKRAAGAGMEVSLLPVWHDVDRPADLVRAELLDEASGAPLTRAYLLRLLKNKAD